ncbi:sodium/glutamate symporter [Mesobacillus subterraneus]|uniref:Sodium:glutamate symporter n=1 Tax=Mesobacillus subterraneus TaxID=285983 RepID=A0A3R9EAK8_9BACI|nr:sodium/glutamate symporter [Mesobacillus subterraneus]RSD27566.1 sodium:glutamate symporter [Mesobacillus subterraneus]
MEFNSVLLAFVLIAVLLAAGMLMRMTIPFFQKYFIPTSLIAGLIGLLVSKEALGKLGAVIPGAAFLENGIYTEKVYETMREIPEVAITIIFASLFLGKKIPGIKKIWEIAGPQVAYGQTVSWAQYVVGLLLAIFLLKPVFDLPPIAGALIEIGFEGGPGTAAGMRGTFDALDFPEGASLALGLATVGILTGVITGIIIVNWGIKKGIAKQAKKASELSERERKGLYPEGKEKTAGELSTKTESIEGFTVNFLFIFVAIGLGMLLLKGLVLLEEATWGPAFDIEVIKHVPLFPMALLGGVATQLLYSKFIPYKLIDKKVLARIEGFSLDVLIVASVATLSISAISENIMPFLILAGAGIALNLAAFFLLAKRMMPEYWLERGVLQFGQSMGMTTTGLLLLQIVDPEKETSTLEGFGYKQILFEPVVGGGLFTAASMPLIVQFGPVALLIGTGVLFLIWLAIGLFYFGKKNSQRAQSEG